jgi:branched-chain amino acid transport system permease protein
VKQALRSIFTEQAAGAVVIGLILLLPCLLGFNPYYLSIFIPALILSAVAMAWNLLAGVCGQVSFGHAAFFGIGAYVSALLTIKGGLNPYAAVPIGGLGGILGSLVIGLPAFRLRGPYFALAILGFAEVVKLLTQNLTWLTGGSHGLLNIPFFPAVKLGGLSIEFYVSRTANYYVACLLVIATYLVIYLLRRSNPGLAMLAVRADDEAAAGIGVPVLRTKVQALAVSAFFTALMGGFYAHYIRFLTPDSAFDGRWSLMPIVASLFGGMETLIGPMVGALVIAGLDEFLFKMMFETGHQLFLGLLLAVVITWTPAGLLGNRLRKTTVDGKTGEKK